MTLGVVFSPVVAASPKPASTPSGKANPAARTTRPTAAPAATRSKARKIPAPAASKTVRRKAAARPAPRADGPAIRSSAAIAIDLADGRVLLSKNADRPRSVASLSKLMAALVLVEHGLDLDGVQTISPQDKRLVRRGAPSRLRAGSAYLKRDLLHAALMVSDNVATVALGRSMGWSTGQFARKMTARARALGLRRTSFHDPTGLDAGNVSTAREMLAILRAAMAQPVIQEIARTEEYTFLALDGPPQVIHYRHTDHYARRFPWKVEGAKTGFTRAAGYCLAIGAQLHDQNIGMIFLGSYGVLTRFGDYARTMQWLERRAAGKKATAERGPDSSPQAEAGIHHEPTKTPALGTSTPGE